MMKIDILKEDYNLLKKLSAKMNKPISQIFHNILEINYLNWLREKVESETFGEEITSAIIGKPKKGGK